MSVLCKDGRPSTDPNDFYDGGLMLPFGGHKGYGLSVMVSILGGNVVAAASEDAESSGVFAVAMDPGTFGDAESVLDGVRATLERLRHTRPADGFSEVLVPGDFERHNRKQNRSGPIELPESTWQIFLDAAVRVGLERDEIARVAAAG
jgi:LDH2 family malate/lactate/ureidoglycolate dehydrogenase